MSEPKKDAPRRYIVDGAGQRVLVGLTISETVEFEALDRPDTDLIGETARVRQAQHGERWVELYIKHERAWSDWMAQTRARLEKPPLVN
ncbi:MULTISPECIES: hypothetical protein [Bradyrhizobium]|jgi:hypothetical protein|uniref:hypothetical protein n=1 Tax=Bradyrhizobium TaxID=374 RepID=UPI001BA64DD0|nr:MULTISPECIES: hypothetical protein [Bradyrhizobium]MBR0810923.1 hypothetical protein [Bradyrhizobium diazoefficiens]WOH72256.1 hypothetical protein RX330_28810 [Bradyrhizobium sp. NDS-1]